MLSIPFIAVFLVVSVCGYFYPMPAGLAFTGIVAAFVLWTAWTAMSPRREPRFLDEAEVPTFRKYSLYFVTPFLAQQYASVCPWIFRFGLLWAAFLGWQGRHAPAGSTRIYYAAAGLSFVLAFASIYLGRMLVPGDYLRKRESKGVISEEEQSLLVEIQAIESKIHYARESELDRRRSTIRGRLI